MDTRYYTQFSQFYTTSVLKDIADRQSSIYINDTIEDSGYTLQAKGITFKRLFEDVYSILQNQYRCEYIYKNSIANSLLLEKHSLSESMLFSEFPVEECRADVVVLNGEATVYEIKTELDSLVRLPSQIDSYLRMFPRVYVVTDQSHLLNLEKTLPMGVGIICLKNDTSLQTIREAINTYDYLSTATIFDSLRCQEYCDIIKKEFGFVPDVPNTRIYAECRKLFCELEPRMAYSHMVSALRGRNKSKHLSQLVDEMPYSLKMVCFQSKLTKSQWKGLRQSLEVVVPV